MDNAGTQNQQNSGNPAGIYSQQPTPVSASVTNSSTGFFPHPRPDFKSSVPAGDIILAPKTKKKLKKLFIILIIIITVILVVAGIYAIISASQTNISKNSTNSFAKFWNLYAANIDDEKTLIAYEGDAAYFEQTFTIENKSKNFDDYYKKLNDAYLEFIESYEPDVVEDGTVKDEAIYNFIDSDIRAREILNNETVQNILNGEEAVIGFEDILTRIFEIDSSNQNVIKYFEGMRDYCIKSAKVRQKIIDEGCDSEESCQELLRSDESLLSMPQSIELMSSSWQQIRKNGIRKISKVQKELFPDAFSDMEEEE